MADMERLDAYMARCALGPSRAKAQRLIRDGSVFVDGVCARKPSAPVPGGAHVDVRGADDYVSRGAYKLLGAFSAFAPHGLRPPEGLDCLDIGASTGGFCDVLLRDGARRVIALDVGHGQLDARIASDPRIIEMSGVNIRDVDPTDLPFAPQMVVSDVSFISLTYVLPVVARSKSAGRGSANTASSPTRSCARARWTVWCTARANAGWMLWRPPSRRSKARTATSNTSCTRVPAPETVCVSRG